jgi:predicted DNA-binding transcriptional regulator YafY
MKRRGFLWAVGAAGFAWIARGSVQGAERVVDVERATKIETLVTQAIRERRCLAFRYHSYSRRVEPHALGEVGENRRAVLAWQFAGGSRSEPPPGWRTFYLSELKSVRILKTKFVRRPDYDPTKAKWKSITVEVAT